MTEQDVIRIYEETTHVKIFSFRQLDGEHDGKLYLINYQDLFRVPGKNTTDQPFADLHLEYQFYEAVNKASDPSEYPVPPFVIIYSDGQKIEKFAEGHEPTFAPETRDEEFQKILEAMAALRRLDCAGDFAPLPRLRHYQKTNKSRLPETFENEIIKRFTEIRDSRPLALCHNRLDARHILIQDERALFLDYSFVGPNTPIYDLADFLVENDFDSTVARKLLNLFNRTTLCSPYSYEELETVMHFIQAFWYYYYSARHAETKEERFAKHASEYKKRFLLAFNARLMEGAE